MKYPFVVILMFSWLSLTFQNQKTENTPYVLAPEQISNPIVSIANHLNNADLSWNTNTDRAYGTTIDFMEYVLFKHNLGGTAFVSNLNGTDAKNVGVNNSWITKSNATGRIEYDMYLRTDYWRPSTSTGTIPNYYSSSYNDLGANVFSTISPRTLKASRGPNWGLEMYIVSDGLYGHDGENYGTSSGSELFNYIEESKGLFQVKYGFSPKGFSYGNGQDGGKIMLLDGRAYSSGRNSQWEERVASNSDSYYGVGGNNPNSEIFNAKYTISKPSSSRFLTYTISNRVINATNFSKSIKHSEDCLLNTFTGNGGFYNNFCHIHYLHGPTSPYTSSDLRLQFETYVSAQRALLDRNSKSAASHGYTSIMHYGLLRDSTNIQAINTTHNSVEIIVMNENKLELNTLACFVVDLAGTALEGKNLMCENCEAFNQSDNIIVLNTNIALNGTSNINLSERTQDNDQLKEISVQASYSSSLLTVSSNDDCKYVVFYKPFGDKNSAYKVLKRTEAFNSNAEITLKTNNLGLSHSAINSGQLAVGALNKFKVSTIHHLRKAPIPKIP